MNVTAPPLTVAMSSSKQATASSSSSTTGNSATDMNNMFLQLLTAQLKAQSPINPLDPNQFVAQLAQFNSLSELVQIRELLQTLVS
jgi:flagellar basal-body rod modification protein FlgD